MLDNKSLASSANYLTDLNSMYSYDIYIKTNNLFVANSTFEANIRYFDRTDSIEKEISLYIGTQLVDNINALTQVETICKNIRNNIVDSTVVNNSYISGVDVIIDIKVTTESTILKDLNIKAKYNSIVKYDLYSVSDSYVQVLTNAGLIDIETFNNINNIGSQILPNLEEILLVDYRAAQVAADTLLVTEMKNNANMIAENIVSVNTVANNLAIIESASENIVDIQNAEENALIAITKSQEAQQSASNASTSEINAELSNQSAISAKNTILAIELQAEGFSDDAEASKNLAEKWASEAKDIVVVSGKYSAYHYMLKAEEYAASASSVIDDNNSSTIATYSSNKIENDLNVIGFDLAANVTVGPGQIAWNSTEGTYDMGLENGSVIQVGQKNIRKVTNNSGALISDGRLVMHNGTNGASGRINVKPFTAGFYEAIKLYGVATQSIADGSDGIITIEGKVRGIDTTGASVGEVWRDNDILYAKPNDAGMMTKIAPADNELKIVVASVIKAHNTNGILEIRFMPFNENAYYTKVENDMLLNSKVPLSGDFTLDLGGL